METKSDVKNTSIHSLNTPSTLFETNDACDFQNGHVSISKEDLDSEQTSTELNPIKSPQVLHDSRRETHESNDINEPQYSILLKLFACLLYAASSSGLTFINKSIYVRYNF